jgi:hypothetical protein
MGSSGPKSRSDGWAATPVALTPKTKAVAKPHARVDFMALVKHAEYRIGFRSFDGSPC